MSFFLAYEVSCRARIEEADPTDTAIPTPPYRFAPKMGPPLHNSSAFGLYLACTMPHSNGPVSLQVERIPTPVHLSTIQPVVNEKRPHHLILLPQSPASPLTIIIARQLNLFKCNINNIEIYVAQDGLGGLLISKVFNLTPKRRRSRSPSPAETRTQRTM